jgi:REP element-mobilizing transposase RayT
MVGTIAAMGMFAYEIYANPDHVHILTTLSRTITIADMISKIKTSSSKWLKTKGIDGFDWQDGYGIFSVSASGVDRVVRYIQNQPAHHRTTDYKDELRWFFEKYGIEYDERYVWD